MSWLARGDMLALSTYPAMTTTRQIPRTVQHRETVGD
jgi:hypothetical protein